MWIRAGAAGSGQSSAHRHRAGGAVRAAVARNENNIKQRCGFAGNRSRVAQPSRGLTAPGDAASPRLFDARLLTPISDSSLLAQTATPLYRASMAGDCLNFTPWGTAPVPFLHRRALFQFRNVAATRCPRSSTPHPKNLEKHRICRGTPASWTSLRRHAQPRGKPLTSGGRGCHDTGATTACESGLRSS